MTEQTVTRHIGDTRTPLPVTIKQPNSSGVDTAINLTGLSLAFKLVDQSGTAVVAATTTGVTITTAASGEAEYDFSTAAVLNAGRYYGYFVLTQSAETDHFPAAARDLVICLEGDA